MLQKYTLTSNMIYCKENISNRKKIINIIPIKQTNLIFFKENVK
jgi:hypothetical protein